MINILATVIVTFGSIVVAAPAEPVETVELTVREPASAQVGLMAADRTTSYKTTEETLNSETVRAQVLQPFPAWLADITGLKQWPSEIPPYIHMPSINLRGVPDSIPRRSLGDCSRVTREMCSFECYRCVASDEIYSCPIMSQTFDDGPSPSTPKLLTELTSKTTFFTQGIHVVRFPETFRKAHALGHLLASHTWSHADLPNLRNEDIVAQLQWSIWAMNATAGVVPRYFRPPYGAIDDRVRAITRQFGLVPVFWDHDTYDWKVNDGSKSDTEVLNDVKQWQKESQNGLILEHDSTINTVNVGIKVAQILGDHQLTVADCVNGRWYQELYPVNGIQ